MKTAEEAKTPTPTPDTKAANPAPASNAASDKAQGTEGTATVNSPDVNKKSTPGMDSDASGSTSLGTQAGGGTEAKAKGTPNNAPDQPIGQNQDGQDRKNEAQVGQQTTSVTAEAGGAAEQQRLAQQHEDERKAREKQERDDAEAAERAARENLAQNHPDAKIDNEKVAARRTKSQELKEKLDFIHENVPASTGDEHVLFGIGGKTFTVGDLRFLLSKE